MKLFDSHCHLYFPQYDADRDAVLARMQEREMGAMVIGTDFATSTAALALAKKHDFLWASVGLHPTSTEDFDMSKFLHLAQQPKVVAVGECGLDYFRSEKSEEQKERFKKHIELALKLKKTLVIHCREAHDDMLTVLSAYSHELAHIPVVMHFFTGSGELAQKYLDLGCYLSFPGPVTYTDMYDDSIRICPLDNMLIETDAPFAAPTPYRSKRNEPAYVEYVAQKVAQIKGISVDAVMEHTVANAKKVFKLQQS